MQWFKSAEKKNLLSVPKENILVFDTETTGLKPETDDEILQISIINGNGEILFNSYIKPEHRKRWPKATEINGITYAMVKNSPTISAVRDEIQKLFQNADLVVGYNLDFDVSFLNAANIYLKPGSQRFDCMYEYSDLRAVPDDYHGGYKWFKLQQVAQNYGFDFTAHDALEDTKATLHVFNSLLADADYMKLPEIKRSTSEPIRVALRPEVLNEMRKPKPKIAIAGLIAMLVGIVIMVMFIRNDSIGMVGAYIFVFGSLVLIVGIIVFIVQYMKFKKNKVS